MSKNNNADNGNKLNQKPDEILNAEVISQICSTPYKIGMMCPPVLFNEFNNSANSIISAFSEGKTVLYPKKKSQIKKNWIFFFSEFGFISGK